MTGDPTADTTSGGPGAVGLVLVSHSPQLSRGAAELAEQMGVGQVRALAAGGTSDGELGTGLDVVERAVRDADGGAGVVLLADIGSAVLTAKTLLSDFEVDPESPRVIIADAPLVEGAVAAASSAGTGADLDAVVAAAQQAAGFRKL